MWHLVAPEDGHRWHRELMQSKGTVLTPDGCARPSSRRVINTDSLNLRVTTVTVTMYCKYWYNTVNTVTVTKFYINVYQTSNNSNIKYLKIL